MRTKRGYARVPADHLRNNKLAADTEPILLLQLMIDYVDLQWEQRNALIEIIGIRNRFAHASDLLVTANDALRYLGTMKDFLLQCNVKDREEAKIAATKIAEFIHYLEKDRCKCDGCISQDKADTEISDTILKRIQQHLVECTKKEDRLVSQETGDDVAIFERMIRTNPGIEAKLDRNDQWRDQLEELKKKLANNQATMSESNTPGPYTQLRGSRRGSRVEAGTSEEKYHLQDNVPTLKQQPSSHPESPIQSSSAPDSVASSSGVPSSGAHSSGAHSSGAHSSGAHSSGVPSSGAHSSGAHSSGVHSSGAHSSGAHSSGAHSSGAHSSGAHSSGAPSVAKPPKASDSRQSNAEEEPFQQQRRQKKNQEKKAKKGKKTGWRR